MPLRSMHVEMKSTPASFMAVTSGPMPPAKPEGQLVVDVHDLGARVVAVELDGPRRSLLVHTFEFSVSP